MSILDQKNVGQKSDKNDEGHAMLCAKIKRKCDFSMFQKSKNVYISRHNGGKNRIEKNVLYVLKTTHEE